MKVLESRKLPNRWLSPDHPIRILLIGAGGNGSEFFDGLMRIHQGMIALGGIGLDVTAYDDDQVSETNIVRQRFWPHEIGENKAVALVHRTNLLMGTNWQAVPRRFNDIDQYKNYDLVVSAVDNVLLRQALARGACNNTLWLDMGCEKDQGQVVLGCFGQNSLSDPYPTVVAHFPTMLNQKDNNRPSCSAADSIARQDLMINQAVAGAATNLLWKSLRSGRIPYNGIIIDLNTGFSQAIPFLPQEHAIDDEAQRQ